MFFSRFCVEEHTREKGKEDEKDDPSNMADLSDELRFERFDHPFRGRNEKGCQKRGNFEC